MKDFSYRKNGSNCNGANTVVIIGISHLIPESNHNLDLFYKHTECHSVKCMKDLDHKMKQVYTEFQFVK